MIPAIYRHKPRKRNVVPLSDSGYFDEVMGNPPAPNTLAWKTWYDGLKAKRKAWCDKPRATTYYFSASGSDANDGLSSGSPKQTIAAAQGIINASSGDIALLFNRGDEFRASAGLIVNKPQVTVAAYGSGAKPIFSAFTVDLLASGGHWTLAAGSRYTKAVANKIGWVRERTNDTARKSPYMRVTSTAAVEANPGSWYWASGTLHIHARGSVDPDTISFEYIDSSVWTGTAGTILSGVDGVAVVHVDGCYVKDIRADGWGCAAGDSWQNYGFRIAVKDRETCVVEDCECYYTGRHGPSTNTTTVGAQGGIAWFINCTSGFTNTTAASANHFNSYSPAAGQETVFEGCNVEFGRAPDATVDGVTVKHDALGTSFYGHAGSGTVRLVIMMNCSTTRSSNPGATYAAGQAGFDATYLPGDDTDSNTFRYYNVGYQCTHLGDTRIAFLPKGWHANWVIDVEVFSTGNASNPTNFIYSSAGAGGVVANCVFRFKDLVSAKTRSIINTTLTCTTRFHHCEIWTQGTHASQGWWIHQGASSALRAGMRIYNSLLHRSGTMQFWPNCNDNAAGTYVSNATRQIDQTGTDGIDSDAEQVILGADLTYGDPPAVALVDGNPTAGGFRLEYDLEWNARNATTPTIGALEA